MAYHSARHAASVQYREEHSGVNRRPDGSVIACQHCLPGLVCDEHAWWKGEGDY